MNTKKWRWIGLTVVLLGAMPAKAQQPPAAMVQANPTPGCTATAEQLEANKKVVIRFFQTTGAERVALADPSYLQHNPVFKKRAQDDKVTDYEEFKNTFLAMANGRGPGLGPGNGPGGPGGGARPPQGNPLEVVTAECDIVTAIHKNYRQDPTADPGTFYEAYGFDTFRVKDGKLVEHWDGALINPPAPAGAPGGPGGPGR
jgi:predicted SnoaL-like aldol condensation-catalyzing enzyme